MFYEVFGLVRNQRQFPSRRIDFIPRTYLGRPTTANNKARDIQSFSLKPGISPSPVQPRVNETKYEKILEAADFASRENCSFIRLKMPSRKFCSRQPKKLLFQTDIQGELWEVMRNSFGWKGGGGGRLKTSEKLIKVYLLQPAAYSVSIK